MQWLGAALFVGMLLPIAGWLTGVRALASWGQGGAQLHPGSALALLGCGAGLFFLGRGRPRVARIFAVLGTVVASVLLAAIALSPAAGATPWGPALHALAPALLPAQAFANASSVLAGLAIVAMAKPTERRGLLTIAGLVLLTLATLPVLSYLVSVSGRALFIQGVSVPGITARFVLAIAVLVGASRGAATATGDGLAKMGAAVSLLVALGVVTVQTNAELIDSGRQRAQAQDVQTNIERVVARVARMETNARGYAISGDEAVRRASLGHATELLRLMARLEELVRDDAAQSERTRELGRRAREKIDQNNAILEARRSSGTLAGAMEAMYRPSPGTANGFIALGNEMKAVEADRLARLEAEMALLARNTRTTQSLGSLVALALIGLTLAQTRRSDAARREAETAMHAANRALSGRVGELAAARAELEAVTRLQRAVLDGTVQSVISTTPDGVITSFNAGAERMLGYARAEVVGRLTPVVLHVESEINGRAAELTAELGRPIAPGFEAVVARARLGEADEREWTYVRKDGSRLPVWLSVTALRDQGGAVTGFLGIARDLTENKRAEDALKASEERLRLVLDEMPVGVRWVRCIDGRREVVLNRAHVTITGVTEVEQRTPGVYVSRTHPEDIARQEEGTTRLRRGEIDQFALEKRYLLPDGATRWVSVSWLRRMLPGEGNFEELSTVMDVSERKEAEIAARATLRQVNELQAALDAHALVIVTDLEGRVTHVNDRFCAVSGYAREELLGDTPRRVSSGDHSPEFFREMWSTIVRGEIWRGELHNRTRGGTDYWVSSAVVPALDESGRPRHFVAIQIDITERKQLEQRLALARDEALEASRLKSEFLATISHEIRTPMNAVIGMAGLLNESALTPEQSEMGRTIQSSAENLLTIINDILDFSRIEAGRLRIDAAEFDLRQIVEQTATLLAPRAHEKGLELLGTWEESPRSYLLGDGGRVRQVLTNLLGNAIKFTDAGEVEVSCSVVRETVARVRVRVAVRDTGIGIAAAEQRLLFQPFTQVDGSATRRFGGTGLGLAISRQLVELMGGKIGVESAPGRGSRFWFEIEFERRGALPALPRASLPVGFRVLVFDEHAAGGRTAAEMLAGWGAQVETVHEASAALARARAPGVAPWNLILVDRRVRPTGGIAFARELRRAGLPAQTRLALMSGASRAGEPESIAPADFAAVLSKPITLSHLARALARMFEAGGAADSARTNVDTPLSRAPGQRILVAEDNPANQRLAELLLKRLGFEVTVAVDGEDALRELAARDFSAVLMDCQMPVLDGYSAARRIRSGAVPRVNAHVPIVAVTAYAGPEDRARSLEAGMDDHVSKPIRPAELQAALQRCGLVSRAAPVPTPVDDEILDSAALETARNLPGEAGGSLLPELVRHYLDGAPAHLARLQTLAVEGRAVALADEAHAFASNAAAFGGAQVRRAALELERAARAGDAEGISRPLGRLREACATLRAEIARLGLDLG